MKNGSCSCGAAEVELKVALMDVGVELVSVLE
jgi:hypothetical protein